LSQAVSNNATKTTIFRISFSLARSVGAIVII
jgi:hypothetical protein